MQLTLPIKPNRNALAFVTAACNPRTTLPILSCIRLTANPDTNEVTVSATDLDVTLSAVLETETPYPAMDAVVNGKTFLGLFKRDKNMIVESADSKVVIAVNGSRFNVPTMDKAEFPPPLKLQTEVTFSVLPTVFAVVLHQVDVAISTDESRYVLNGVFFDGKVYPSLTLVGTDGQRLHKASLPIESAAIFDKDFKGFILPSCALAHLHKLLKEQPEGVPVKVEVNAGRNLIRITGSRLTMVSKLIEGQYPNYPQVIPTDEAIKIKVAVDVPAWITALEAVKPFTSDAWNSVKITLSDNLVTFLVKNNDVGEGIATVAINNKAVVNIFFDPDYLLEALLPHKEASYEVHIGFVDDVSPCVITTSTTTTAIMPKRVS